MEESMFRKRHLKNFDIEKQNYNLLKGIKFTKRFILISLGLLLLGSIIFLFMSPFLKIKNISFNFQSLDCVDEKIFLQYFPLINKNIILINETDIAKEATKKFYCLKYLKINKKLPDTLDINLTGRKPAAILDIIKLIRSSSPIEAIKVAIFDDPTSIPQTILSLAIVY